MKVKTRVLYQSMFRKDSKGTVIGIWKDGRIIIRQDANQHPSNDLLKNQEELTII